MAPPAIDQATGSLDEKDTKLLRMANDIDSLSREIEATNHGIMAMHKELEDRGIDLESARRRLAVSEKLAALGSLVAGVAHEVRTPLTIIAANLHVLERRASIASRTGDYAPLAQVAPQITRDVIAAMERVQGLVKDLSRFTQVKSLTEESLLDPIVREAVDLYSAVNRSRTQVECELRSLHPVFVDKTKIQQIVINLIENAVQASSPGGKPVRIRTYADDEGTGVILEVEDEGMGMTPVTQARMFEPLFTTKDHGTGVGLTIVQRIVQEHHATIDCRSEPGQGTTFRVHFPGSAKVTHAEEDAIR